MKNFLLIAMMASVVGGCAGTDVARGYLDHTAAMTEEQKTARLLPYSGATQVQVTEVPFETMVTMVNRGYFLLGEAVYDNRGQLTRQRLAADAAEVGADVVVYCDYAAGRPFWKGTLGNGGPTFQGFASGEASLPPAGGSLTAGSEGTLAPQYYALFWRKANG